MKKIILALLISMASLGAYSQCTPILTTAHIFTAPFRDSKDTTGARYSDYMCGMVDTLLADTLGGAPGWQFFYSDGYGVKLVAGSQITVSTFMHNNSTPVGLTIVDTAFTVIASAHSNAALNNVLNFTATYTGLYYVVFDSSNVCGIDGAIEIASVKIVLNNSSSIVCPAKPVNDTICGAIAMTLATVYSGNNADASITDPRDNDVNVAGYACSAPNNTLWYKYTSTTTDTFYITSTSPGTTSGLDGWVGWFTASNCNGTLTYKNCMTGAAQGVTTIDTVVLTAGETNYFMVDGFLGAVGAFTISLTKSNHSNHTNGLNSLYNNPSIVLAPNPTTDFANIIFNKKIQSNTSAQILDITGKLISEKNISDNNSTIDLSKLNAGTYLLKVMENNKIIYINRIVKQ
jgi:hypothetical protein